MSDISMNRPWWKEPMLWLVIGLPISAVIGGALTFMYATANPDPLVSEDYTKQGFTVRQDKARDERAVALKLAAELRVEAGELVAEVRADGAPLAAAQLELALVHPTQAEQDLRLRLAGDGQGRFRAALPELAAGRRQAVLEPMDRDWRLAQAWQAPFQGTLRMAPASPR